MLNQLFGKYLVDNGKLTRAQYQLICEKQASARVKLGLIAVEENLLTKEQSEELNQLQTQMDKRFGDLAVEKGYLTDDQVSMLLKKQGNAYLQFIQTMSESGFMNLSDIDENLQSFITASGYTKSDIDTLKSGDVSEIASLFISDKNQKLQDILAIILRNITRFISSDFYIENSQKVSSVKFVNIAGQNVVGDDNYSIGFIDSTGSTSFTHVASMYDKSQLKANSPETFDALCEFVNCVNGLYVTNEASDTSDIDMAPPFSYKNGEIKGDFYIIPINIGGAQLSIFIDTNNIPDVSGEKIEAIEVIDTETKNGGAKKILIVDDSRMSRKVLRDILEDAGYCVVAEAINGKDGVAKYVKHSPDLVTMDITMPEMDGIYALKEIIKIDSKAKVVMLSAAGMKAKVVEAIKCGAKEFISKPIEKDAVIKIVNDTI